MSEFPHDVERWYPERSEYQLYLGSARLHTFLDILEHLEYFVELIVSKRGRVLLRLRGP